MMTQFDDLNEITCYLQPVYLEMLKDMPVQELRALVGRVKEHKKHSRQSPAFSDVRNFSTHDALIGAIKYELLKRSRWKYTFYKRLMRIRRPILRIFSGVNLEEHNYLGTLYKIRKSRHYYLYMPHYEFFPKFGDFLVHEWKFIVGAIFTVIGLYIAWVKR